MSDQQLRGRLERLSERIETSPRSFDKLTERRSRSKRRHDLGTIVVALAIAASGTLVVIRALGGQPAPGPLTGSNSGSVITTPPCPVSSAIRLVGTLDVRKGFDTDCLAIVANRETPVTFILKPGDPPEIGNPQILAFCTLPDCSDLSSVFRTDIATAPAVVTGTLPALAPGTYYFLDQVHPTWRGTLYVVAPETSP